MKNWLKYTFRITVSAIAVYIVYRKIDMRALADFAGRISPVMVFISLVVYNCSQVISSKRLFGFLKVVDPGTDAWWNLRLYYRGMFYNLFLPGSVTGDAYKIVILKRRSGASYNLYVTAILLDRLTGLVMILLIVALLFFVTFAGNAASGFWYLLAAGSFILPLLLSQVVKKYFSAFRVPLLSAWLSSFVIQLLQLASLLCILRSLGAVTGQFFAYALMFYISSLLSALPITMGGLGARELTFLTGAAFFHLQSTVAVAAAFLFFLVVAISSLAGAWLPAATTGPEVSSRHRVQV